MQTINCEITKVFDRNIKTIGFALKPLDPTNETMEYIKYFVNFIE